MNATLQSRYVVARDVLARKFHDETILLDLAGGEYFSVDEVGSRVWDGLGEGKSVGDVAAALALEYDSDLSRLELDVLAFTEELVGRRILVEALK
jgi:hypothetical protein